MQNKIFIKFLTMVLTGALLFTSLVPFSSVMAGVTPFTTDTFDDQTYSNATWVTERLNAAGTLNAYSYGNNGTEKFLKPAWHTTAYSAFTMVNSTTWPTDRIKEVEVRVKINSTTKNTWPTYLAYYYDSSIKSYAGLELGVGNNTNSTLAYRNSAGACNTVGVTGGSTTVLADVAANNANQWVTVNFVYDYTNFNAATRQLKVTFQIKLQDSTVVATGQLRTVSLTTVASQKVFFAIGNDTASGNSSIDYVNVLQTEAVTDQETATMFQTKYATLLAKAVNDVTIANDDSTISEALLVYGSLSTSVKALLTAENTKLTSMKSYLKFTVTALTEDAFSDSTYTNSAWITEKSQTGVNVNPNFGLNNNGTDYYLTPAVAGLGYSYSAFTRPRDSYTSNGNLKKVTARVKGGANGWYGGDFLWYYDPVTKISAGIDFTSKTYNSINYLAYRAYSNSLSVSQAGYGPINLTSLQDSNLLLSDWITIEATYDFTNFNAAIRQLKIAVVFKKDDGSYTSSTSNVTITLPQWASQNVNFAISSTTSAINSPVYDYVKAEYILTPYAKAEMFKAKYATTLAKNPSEQFSADEIVKLNATIDEFFTLDSDVQSVLITDGTKAKLEQFVVPYSDSDPNAIAFRTNYSVLLKLNDNQVTPAVQNEINTALNEFLGFSALTKMILANEKIKLDHFVAILIDYIEPRTDNDFSPFVENFDEGLKKWKVLKGAVTTAQKTDFQIVADPENPNNKVLSYVANNAFLAPNDIVWPKKGAMTTLSFKMRVQDFIGNPQAKNSIIASFIGVDDWMGAQWGGGLITGVRIMQIGKSEGDDVLGTWGSWTTFNPAGWFDVSITYSSTSANILLVDEKGNTMTCKVNLKFQNGRLAFGRPSDMSGTMYKIWVDDININFSEVDWDNDIVVNDIKTYYNGNTFVKPGEISLISGENLGNTVSDAYIMQLSDVKNPVTVDFVAEETYHKLAPTGGRNATFNDVTARKLDIIQRTPSSIKFIIPKDYTKGAYVVKLVPKNLGVFPKYVYINNPKPNFVLGDEGEVATRGGLLRVIGSNLAPTGAIGDITMAIKNSSGDVTFIPITKIEQNDMYSLEAKIPENTPFGSYQLFVHNGYGDATAWSNPMKITVGSAPKDSYSKTRFNVKDFGALGDARTNDTPAIVAALTAAAKNGGGVVYLPIGIYRVINALVIPENVEFMGDGCEKSSIAWSATRWPYGKLPQSLISFTNNVEIHDLGFQGTRFKGIFNKNSKGINANVSIHDIRVQFYPYSGAPTSGAGVPTGEMTPAEMAIAIMQESKGSYFNFDLGSRNEATTNVKLENIVFSSDRPLESSMGIVGNLRYWKIKNVNIDEAWSPINSQEAGIMENCSFQDACLGVNGNFYLARNSLKDLKRNNRELYTSDGKDFISNAIIQFVGPEEEVMGVGNTDEVTYMFTDKKQTPGTLVGFEIFIVSGQGTGQVRKIVSNDAYTFKVNEPFSVPPNRNSRISVHTPRSGSRFINNVYENGMASGTYGTTIDAVWDGNQFIRHGGQVFTLLDGVTWYISIMNSVLKDPFYMHGDGDTSQSKIGIGFWQFNFGGGITSLSSMGYLFKHNQMLDGSYMNVAWYGRGANGTRDFIIENNFFEEGAVGINTTLAATNSAVADGVILKDNSYGTTDLYLAGFRGVFTSSSTTINRLGIQRFIDLDLKNIIPNLSKDVNGDGVVSLKDSTLIRYYLQEKTTLTADQLRLADANGDGVVDLKDATYIRKLFVN